MLINSISPILSFKGNINKNKISVINGKTQTDSFERTISKAQSDNEAVNWLKNSGFIKQELFKILSDDNNKIGQGFHHCVYSIPDNEDYVLRTSNYFDLNKINTAEYQIKDTQDKNLKVNIGQEVAQIAFLDENGSEYSVSVLRKQHGKPVGVPPFQAISYESGQLKEGEAEYDSKINKDKYAASIKALANMPVSAYEKLLDDLKHTNELGYYFDYLNSNNLMYDENSQTISLIDMDKNSGYLNYGNVLYALSNINYNTTYSGNFGYKVTDDEKYQAIEDTVTIIDKYMQAMKNKGLKIDKDSCTYEFMKLFLSVPFCLYCKSMDNNTKWQKLQEMGIIE